MQIALNLPPKYATEEHDSFISARRNAFSSKLPIGKSFEAVALGQPVIGLLAPSGSEYTSAQLVGRL